MIKTLHKYQKSVVGTFMVLTLAFGMIGFGMNSVRNEKDDQAITVNDQSISLVEFYKKKEMLERRYRQMLGPNYAKFRKELNLNQRLVDESINDLLLDEMAHKLGLVVSTDELAKIIRTQILPQGATDEVYRQFLEQNGMTSIEFENSLRQELLRDQIKNLFLDASKASDAEIRALVRQDKSTYGIKYATFSPSEYEGKVQDPSPEILTKYYEDNAVEFQEPPRVSYDFAVLDPKANPELVKIDPADVELYYSEHLAKFKTPDEVKVRQIKLTVPGQVDDEKKAEIKKKAQDILQQLKGGASFEELAKKFSDDEASKEKGGDLDWVKRGTLPTALDKAVFRLKGGNDPEMVETPFGFYLVKVEGFRQGTTKPLSEVRGEIESFLRKEEEPSWLSSQAQILFDQWTQEGSELSTFGQSHGLRTGSTKGALSEQEEADSVFKGLTAQILNSSDQKKQMIEINDIAVLVSIKEYKAPVLPPLETIKEKVLAKYKQGEAVKLADAYGAEVLKNVKEKTVEEVSREKGIQFQEKTGINRTETLSGELAHPEVRQTLFDIHTAPQVFPRVIDTMGKKLVIVVTSITAPSEEEIKKAFDEYRPRASQQAGAILLTSVLKQAEAQAKKVIDQRVLNSESEDV